MSIYSIATAHTDNKPFATAATMRRDIRELSDTNLTRAMQALDRGEAAALVQEALIKLDEAFLAMNASGLPGMPAICLQQLAKRYRQAYKLVERIEDELGVISWELESEADRRDDADEH